MLTTGGTGGHVFPALAVAEEIRFRFPRARILFLGGEQGPEGRWARQAGLEFVGLPARGVFGRGWRALGALFWLGVSLIRAVGIVRRFRPEAVLGFGGYAAFAGVAAAAIQGVPTAIHEQNSIAGVANRLLGRMVRKVFLSFPDERGMFDSCKAVLTGNPVRSAIRCAAQETVVELKDRPARLLVVGGSQGARAVNTAVVEALPRLAAAGVHLRHQTGAADYERMRQAYAERGCRNASVEPFIEDMAGAYAWADLVLCRAGASTVAELAVAGKPALFVPFPYATHDHQTANARFLERAGAALVVEQKELNRLDLAEILLDLLGDRSRLAEMGRAGARAGRADAAAAVVEELEQLAGV